MFKTRHFLKIMSLFTLPTAGFAQPLVNVITEEAARVGVPPELLVAICKVESNLQPNAINKADGEGGHRSTGLCQVKPNTAKWMRCAATTSKDLLNPRLNARCAAMYLKYQLKRYNDNWDDAIVAYNAGRVKLTQTGEYVNGKYKNRVYRRLYEVKDTGSPAFLGDNPRRIARGGPTGDEGLSSSTVE